MARKHIPFDEQSTDAELSPPPAETQINAQVDEPPQLPEQPPTVILTSPPIELVKSTLKEHRLLSSLEEINKLKSKLNQLKATQLDLETETETEIQTIKPSSTSTLTEQPRQTRTGRTIKKPVRYGFESDESTSVLSIE